MIPFLHLSYGNGHGNNLGGICGQGMNPGDMIFISGNIGAKTTVNTNNRENVKV